MERWNFGGIDLKRERFEGIGDTLERDGLELALYYERLNAKF